MIQNLETAIASEQQAGADTSALEELKGKMESAKSEAAQAKPDVEAQAIQADAQRNMTRAVAALTNLPADVQAKADAGAARHALYDYMKADESGKAAAYSKATEQLKKSISAALETEGLDKWTRQTLEEMLDNIDSEGKMGDNKAEILAHNREKGKNFEKHEFATFIKGKTHAAEQITLKTVSIRTRVDAIGLDESGHIVINEFKSSCTAPLTNNQKIAFPELYDSGGIVVGKGKGIFRGGYEIPIGTMVKIIRPEK